MDLLQLLRNLRILSPPLTPTMISIWRLSEKTHLSKGYYGFDCAEVAIKFQSRRCSKLEPMEDDEVDDYASDGKPC